jgi:hypothetical protein
MTNDQQPAGPRRYDVLGQAILPSVGFYLLAAGLSAVVFLVLTSPMVDEFFIHLSWQMGPHGGLPFPEELNWDVRRAERHELTSTALTIALGLTLVVAIGHALTFASVVWAHAWFGWPRYWRETRPRINLAAAWVMSARRAWWIVPAGVLVWFVLDDFSLGWEIAGYPIIRMWRPFGIAYVVAVVLLCGLVAARVLRSAVADAVEPDNLRCLQCGYSLRGLDEARCPECGAGFGPQRKAEFGLYRHRGNRSRMVPRVVLVAWVTAVALAPVWLPLSLLFIPRQWMPHVPVAIRPHWRVMSFDPNRLPIHKDAVCVIRHDDAIALVTFKSISYSDGEVHALYWADERRLLQQRPPDTTSGGRVYWGETPLAPIGPWHFRIDPHGSAFMLERPDENVEIEAYLPDDVPPEFSWVFEAD